MVRIDDRTNVDERSIDRRPQPGSDSGVGNFIEFGRVCQSISVSYRITDEPVG